MRYRSETDPDFQALEKMLINGQFGPIKFLETNDLFHNEDLLTSIAPHFKELADKLEMEPFEFQFASMELPTRYDNPFAFHILAALTDDIKQTCKEINWDTSDFPDHACIPTGSVNAHAVRLKISGRQFIIFDSQLFFFCNLFSKAVAMALPVEDVKGHYKFNCEIENVLRHLSADATGLRELEALLEADFQDGPSSAPQTIPSKPYVAISQMLRESMELFLVAHEYGHILRNHLGTSKLLSAVAGLSQGSQHQKEFEADAVGWLLSFMTMRRKGYDVGTSYIGAALLFQGFELREKYAYLRNKGSMAGFSPSSKGSHPENSDRVAMMNRVAAKFIASPALDQAVELQRNYYEIVNAMFDIIVRKHVG